MNYGAFGLVEVVGSSNAILVIDQIDVYKRQTSYIV